MTASGRRTPLATSAAGLAAVPAADRRRGRRGALAAASGETPLADASATASCTAGRARATGAWSTTPCSPSLRALVPLAPLHLPTALAGIEAAGGALPGVPQVACFDTALPPRPARRSRGACRCRERLADARRPSLRLSRPLVRVRRRAARRRPVRGRVGASRTSATAPAWRRCATAARRHHDGAHADRRAHDGHAHRRSRSGRARSTCCGETGYDAARLDRLVERESGLLGVSGTTPTCRRCSDDGARRARARWRSRCSATRCASRSAPSRRALGGLDTLVFTGGIGEHAAPVRAEICAGLGHLGVRLDPARNDAPTRSVSAPGQRLRRAGGAPPTRT